MDITEINKIAGRKRMSADVEKLREKVSRENKKIIKLKVSQDTAYWDLQEKLRQVETNHEKLQQNMLEVQMQYETVSGQYQDELRQRAETLNKLASTREICSVLEDYSERLRDTLSRCKADQAALYEAYQTSGKVLRDLKNQHVQQQERNRQTISTLEEKLKLTTEHQNQLLQYFTEEKQRSIIEFKEIKEKLSIAVQQNNESQRTHIELNSQLENCRRDLKLKEEDLCKLQSDINEVIRQFNTQANEMKNEMMKKEKDLQESAIANESLKQALLNQEAFTKSICEQENLLKDKIAALEEVEANAQNIINDLETKLQEVKLTNNKLTTDLENIEDKNITLEKQIAYKNEQMRSTEKEIKMLKDQLSTLDLEKREIVEALEKAGEEAQTLVAKIKQMSETGGEMVQKIQKIEDAMKTSKANAEIKLKELADAIELKNKELENKTSSISHLMNEVKAMSDDRAKLESTVLKIQQELREKQDTAAEKEKRLSMRIEQLEVIVKSKDNELSKNLSIILELRSDKERLNVEIENMQKMFDNIQKEITRPAIKQPRIEPDLDDNAVMLTPTSKRNTPLSSNSDFCPPPPPSRPKDINDDSLLFNFLSDNSMDGDHSINAKFGNRRFEVHARDGQLSQSVKRRRTNGAPGSQGGLRLKQLESENKSLSQVKASMQPSKDNKFFKTKRDKTKY